MKETAMKTLFVICAVFAGLASIAVADTPIVVPPAAKNAPKAGTAAPAAKTPAPKDNTGIGAGDTVPTDPSDLPPGRPVADGADIDTTPPAAP
jgi:hypothetical protein